MARNTRACAIPLRATFQFEMAKLICGECARNISAHKRSLFPEWTSLTMSKSRRNGTDAGKAINGSHLYRACTSVRAREREALTCVSGRDFNRRSRTAFRVFTDANVELRWSLATVCICFLLRAPRRPHPSCHRPERLFATRKAPCDRHWIEKTRSKKWHDNFSFSSFYFICSMFSLFNLFRNN